MPPPPTLANFRFGTHPHYIIPVQVKQDGINSALNPCGSGSSIIYAWAQNAPKLQLPNDVAFRVGGPDSGVDWLVLQVRNVALSEHLAAVVKVHPSL